VKRREFITLLGGVTAWPLGARAQQSAMPVIGWLSSRTAATDAQVLPAFREGLKVHGFDEGQNVAIEYRFAETQTDRLPALAADLVKLGIAVVIAVGDGVRSTRAARAASASTPIVFLSGADPVKVGLVPNLNRPGGNTTGATAYFRPLSPKRLELLHEVVPHGRAIAVIVSPSIIAETEEYKTDLEAAARGLGKTIRFLEVEDDAALGLATAELSARRPDALLVESGGFFFSRSRQIVDAAARLALPGLYFRREFVTFGGLMSYGSSGEGNYRVLGDYAGRILKGDRAGDLPVQQPTKYEFVLNLKTAKALGLAVPLTLQARADEVIE
jgi:putative ABC transport system substrate-binding protein